MTSNTVRPASVLDAEAIGQVNLLAWTDRLGDQLPADVLGSLRADDLAMTWASGILNPPVPGQRVVVALGHDDDNPVVGYAAFGPSQDPDALPGEFELAALEVVPSQQRQGHASRLLAAIADLVVEAGGSSIVTWCPLTDSVRRAFLQSAGWEPDAAYRDLDLGDGTSLREVRLVAGVG